MYNNLNFLKMFVIVAIAISTLNLIRGGIDYYQTWINDENFWGPTHMKEIHERVERIEKKLNQGVNENGTEVFYVNKFVKKMPNINTTH